MDDAALLALCLTKPLMPHRGRALHGIEERFGKLRLLRHLCMHSATIPRVMTNLHAQMREDIEEALFRFVESVSRERTWQLRIQRGVRIALKTSIAEQRLFKRDGLHQAMSETAARWGKFRGPRMARELGVDIHDPRSLGKIQDWEDALFGVTGHWAEEASHTREGTPCLRATKHETECPFAEVARHDPRICTDMIHRLETETFRAINPTYRLVPLTRLLSKGDASCAFTHEVQDERRAGE
jgi:hypothetical protein